VPAAAADVRIDVLGVPVDVLTRDALLARVGEWLSATPPVRARVVAYLNVHVLDTALRVPSLARFLREEADLVYCDGDGIRHAARLLAAAGAGGGALPERMTGADWIDSLAARAAREGWRLAWIGGYAGGAEGGTAGRAARALRRAHPGLQLHAEHGFHVDEDALLERVRAFAPDLVLVGMGTPAQEGFVERNAATLGARVVWTVGALAELVAGDVPRGPRWLHRRQEWLARLLVNPRRTWRRYTLGNARVAGRIARAIARGAHARGDSTE